MISARATATNSERTVTQHGIHTAFPELHKSANDKRAYVHHYTLESWQLAVRVNVTRGGERCVFSRLLLLLLLLRGSIAGVSQRQRRQSHHSLAVGFNIRELVTAELGRSNWHSCCHECSAFSHVCAAIFAAFSDVVIERYTDLHTHTHTHTRRYLSALYQWYGQMLS